GRPGADVQLPGPVPRDAPHPGAVVGVEGEVGAPLGIREVHVSVAAEVPVEHDLLHPGGTGTGPMDPQPTVALAPVAGVTGDGRHGVAVGRHGQHGPTRVGEVAPGATTVLGA